MDEKKVKRDLFCGSEVVEITKTSKKELKEKVELAEPIVELVNLPSVCVFYPDILKPLLDIAENRNINIYVYQRSRGGRYRPPNRYYYGIYAVPCGVKKASQAKMLTEVLAYIEDFPSSLNHRRSSTQYKLLKEFLWKLAQK